MTTAAAATRALPDHGTAARYQRGCHEECCRRAETYRKKRRAVVGPLQMTPEIVNAHMRKLLAAGASRRSIAEAADCGIDTVNRALNGSHAHMRITTAKKILAVKSAPEVEVPVDAAISSRQVRALVAAGHQLTAIQAEAGSNHRTITNLVSGRATQVWVRTAERIDAAYAVLSRLDGMSTQCKRRGERNGWPTPAQWAEDITDLDVDPAEVFSSQAQEPTPDQIVENAEWLRDEHGMTWDAIAMQLNIRKDTLHTYRTRVRERAASTGVRRRDR
jgi:hypothetical protein